MKNNQTESDGYLSRDPARIAENQRARRRFITRIDYQPGRLALAVIGIKREQCRPGSQAATNSAVLDAILAEWAELTGINWGEVEKLMTSGSRPELLDSYARAYDFGVAKTNNPTQRTACGATRHRDGQPCEARPEPGKRRCRFHGGRSTGPRSAEGRGRALANLRQYRSLGVETTDSGCRG